MGAESVPHNISDKWTIRVEHTRRVCVCVVQFKNTSTISEQAKNKRQHSD